MNRRELALAIAEDLDTDRRAAEAFITSFVEVVTTQVAKGEPVLISGFAKFARVDRAARMGRNPQTGEPMKIAASRKVRISPLKALKDSVLSARKRR